MTESTGFPPLNPEQNRAEWLAAHPGAAPVSGSDAAAQLGAQMAAGSAGGTGDAELAAQMRAAGAAAGLPNEASMDSEMARLKAMVEGMGTELVRMQRERQQERAAAIAALGEPILERYAKGVRDKLTAHQAANPGAGPDHFKTVIADAGTLVSAAADAISRGGNDLGQVHAAVSRIDRWLSKTHPRTAPGHLAHIDLSSVAYDLEEVVTEALQMAPGMLALA